MFLPNILNLIFLMIVARILSDEGMNEYTAVIGYVALFALVSDFGLTSILVREVAKDSSKMHAYFPPFFTIRIITAVLMTIVAITLLPLMNYPGYIKGYIIMYAFAQLIFQVSQIFSSSFQAYEKMEYIGLGTFIQTAIFFVIGLFFIYSGMGVPGLIYANIIANAVLLVVFAFFTQRKITNIRLGLDWGIGKYLIVAGLPFSIYSIFNVLYGYVDRFMLTVLMFDEVAIYTLPYTLVMALSFISVAYMSSVFPAFTKMVSKKSDMLKYACERSFKYLSMIMLPICVGTTLLSDRIIYTVYGPAFTGAIPVLRILIWILAFTSINAIGFTLLNASHREKANLVNLIVCTTLNAALNLIIIPIYGAVGSSYTSLLTVGILNTLITVYLIRDDFRGISVLSPIVRALAASAVMAAAIMFINLDNLFLFVAMGAVVYFIAYVLLGGIAKEDIELAMTVLRRSPKTDVVE